MKRKTTFSVVWAQECSGCSDHMVVQSSVCFGDLPHPLRICFLGCFSIRSKGIFQVLILFLVSSFCTLIFVLVVMISGHSAAWWAHAWCY